MNLMAYAHLIPVIDGGIAVRANRSASLRRLTGGRTPPPLRARASSASVSMTPAASNSSARAFSTTPPILRGCSMITLSRPARMSTPSLSCGSFQVLRMLAYAIAPLGLSNPGAQLYHFVGGEMAPLGFGACKPTCAYPGLVALGDDSGIAVTRPRPNAPEIESTARTPPGGPALLSGSHLSRGNGYRSTLGKFCLIALVSFNGGAAGDRRHQVGPIFQQRTAELMQMY